MKLIRPLEINAAPNQFILGVFVAHKTAENLHLKESVVSEGAEYIKTEEGNFNRPYLICAVNPKFFINICF